MTLTLDVNDGHWQCHVKQSEQCLQEYGFAVFSNSLEQHVVERVHQDTVW